MEKLFSLIGQKVNVANAGEYPFLFPEQFTLLVLVAVISFLVVALITRLFTGKAFMILVVSIIFSFCLSVYSYFSYDKSLRNYIDRWLAEQKVYSILFQDFPQDRERFVADFYNAFQQSGQQGIVERLEEEKLIMLVNHIRHYSQKIPTDVLIKYLEAYTDQERTLLTKDPILCKKYIDYSGHYKEVMATIGEEPVKRVLATVPEMIIAAYERPEYTSWILNYDIYPKAQKLSHEIWEKAALYGIDKQNYKQPENACRMHVINYELALGLGEKDAALMWKLWLKNEIEDRDKK